MEADKIAISSLAPKEALWLRQLCNDLLVFKSQPTPELLIINSDFESALKAIKNPVFQRILP
jgi:hypothetical protein